MEGGAAVSEPTEQNTEKSTVQTTDQTTVQKIEQREVSWHDIHIAGRQFNIASRRGADHVRALEGLIGETVQDMNDLLDGQGPATTALLIALNLADQLLSIREKENEYGAKASDRLESLVRHLSSSLDIQSIAGDHKEGENTATVYEKLEFF